MPAERYRAAIIGCGGIGRAHAGAYRQVGVPIAAVADVREEGLAAFGERYGVEARYRDYRALLAEQRPEIVSVCTWPPLHEEMVLEAAAAGARAVVCEKPLTLSLASADRMIEACRAAGALLVVGHQRRYGSHWRLAREWISEGAIGPLERIDVSIGGDLLSDGVHGLNLAQFWSGDAAAAWVIGQIDRPAGAAMPPPEAGTRAAAGWRYGHVVEAGAVLTAGLHSGVTIHLESGNVRQTKPYIDIVAIGAQGLVRATTDGVCLKVGPAGRCEQHFEHAEGLATFSAEMRDVVRCLDGELSEHPLDVKYHRPALELALGAYVSARRRGRIPLPLTDEGFPLAEMIAAGEI
ncbi:MAG TPA: Gfo/Idh/MocA family oxidoreductase [Limnochordia bacterium]